MIDANRDGREMNNTLWYPAIAPEKPTKLQQAASRRLGWVNAAPDLKAGRFPLILFSHGWHSDAIEEASIVMLMVSHGFVVVGLQHTQEDTQLSFVNRPMDVLFVLDQLTTNPPSDLAGLIDTDHVGILGNSYGAYTTLAMTGARIDPAAVIARTANPISTSISRNTDPRILWADWNWDTLTAYRASFSPLKSGELWPAYTDKRILAAAMDSPCDIPMFGEQGLAAATVPVLIVAGTKDDSCPYEQDTAYAFAHLGSPDRYLLSIVNGGHVPTLNYALPLPLTAQLYTAFFEKYLKGQEEDAKYLTAEYIDSVEAQLKLGLLWGPYTKQ